MRSKVKISGGIISELSEKVPSNIIALNELIKNSYDAGASIISITLNSSKKQLIITDNGSGMAEEDINTLFHISKSDKKYGEKNLYNRYTQGSKGLGFLSVFKFGHKVEWHTKKEKIAGLSFSIDYDKLVNLADISEFEVELQENKMDSSGTSLIISLSDFSLDSLKEYLQLEKNRNKIGSSG